MSKASWKIPVVSKRFLSYLVGGKSIYRKRILSNRSNFSRAFMIPHSLVGQRAWIYNGLQFVRFIIRKKMVGIKFGELAITKSLGRAVYERRKQKNKRKRK